MSVTTVVKCDGLGCQKELTHYSEPFKIQFSYNHPHRPCREFHACSQACFANVLAKLADAERAAVQVPPHYIGPYR